MGGEWGGARVGEQGGYQGGDPGGTGGSAPGGVVFSIRRLISQAPGESTFKAPKTRRREGRFVDQIQVSGTKHQAGAREFAPLPETFWPYRAMTSFLIARNPGISSRQT